MPTYSSQDSAGGALSPQHVTANHISTGDPQTATGLACLLWDHAPFPWGSPGAHRVSVCARQEWSLCFPPFCESSAIKFCWPSKSDSLGIPFPSLDPQPWNPDRGPRIFTTVQDLLWYYCPPVCWSPTQWVWGLILSWLCSSYHLTETSPLSLDMGYLFSGFQCLSVNSCSTAGCDFGVLAEEDECTSLHFTILNQNFPYFLRLSNIALYIYLLRFAYPLDVWVIPTFGCCE